MDISVEILDISGKIVLLNEKKILPIGVYSEEIDFFEKGYYLLRVISSEGVYVKSIVVN